MASKLMAPPSRTMKKLLDLHSLKAQLKRTNFWLLLIIAMLSIGTVFGLMSIKNNVAQLELRQQAHSRHLIMLLDQSKDLADIQITFKRQVQEWKDLLLRGADAQLYQQYLTGFVANEAIVQQELIDLKRELKEQSSLAQTQLSPMTFGASEQLHNLQSLDLSQLSFTDKIEVITQAHRQLGLIYREALARFPLSAGRDNIFELDKNVRGIDRWLSAQLAKLSAESIQTQTSSQAIASARNQQDIHQLRLDIQNTVVAILVALLANLILLADRLRNASHELNTTKHDADAAIYQLAYSDALTGLPNRRLFQDRLDNAIAISSNTGCAGGLIFLDLDNFKFLNDSKGHAQGDLLLIEVAQRLRAQVRSSDVVARLGGDEFVVILHELRGDAESAAEQAGNIAEKICLALGEPYELKEHTHHGGASLGVALFNYGEVSSEELLKRADTAMYQAKRAGRNTVRFYDAVVQENLEARSALESSLHHALTAKQFELHYQVQVDHHHRAIGAEALLRWHHPELGLLHPNQFVALAEESELIVQIGNWVLHTACAQIKAWEAHAHTRDLVLSINVSAAQLRKSKHMTKPDSAAISTSKLHKPGLVEEVQIALQRWGINPARLKIEITESMALLDIEHTVGMLQHFKALGVTLSMDDFGTGHSSLAHLKRMPLDQIKIDQSFVAHINNTGSFDPAIVKSMIEMAGALKMSIIAEGVETQQQETTLTELGCHKFQGYLLGKPMPIDEFEASLLTLKQI
jgi:diguanylate cyclase (GGDEF)-like protein